MVTVALGTTAPDGSDTIPVTSPDTSDCATADLMRTPESSAMMRSANILLACINFNPRSPKTFLVFLLQNLCHAGHRRALLKLPDLGLFQGRLSCAEIR